MRTVSRRGWQGENYDFEDHSAYRMQANWKKAGVHVGRLGGSLAAVVQAATGAWVCDGGREGVVRFGGSVRRQIKRSDESPQT